MDDRSKVHRVRWGVFCFQHLALIWGALINVSPMLLNTLHDCRYIDSSALSGDIRRLSSNSLTPAELVLPAPGSRGSLSYNQDIVIDAAKQV